MEQINSFDFVTIVGLILSIVSIVLAIVSVVFSALFFWWGKKENDSTSRLTAKIEEKVCCLEKLFDKMYDSTYQIVRENNQAMQRHLFPGVFETQTIENRDMDVFLLIGSKKKILKEEICSQLNITREEVETIINRMSRRGKVIIDGETILAVDDISESINVYTDSDAEEK